MEALDDVPAVHADRQRSAASEYAFGRTSAGTSEASRGSRPRRAAPAGSAGRSRSDSASVADSDDASTMSCSMPEGWRRYTTPDGRPYFFNPAAGGGTQWEPPVLRYVTDDGRAYFYDPITRTTSWDQPEGIGGWQEPIVKQMQRRQAAQMGRATSQADGHIHANGGEGAAPPAIAMLSSEQRRSRLPPDAVAAAAAASAADADEDDSPQVESPQPSGGSPLDGSPGIVVDLAALSSASGGGLTSGQPAPREASDRPPPQPPPQPQQPQPQPQQQGNGGDGGGGPSGAESLGVRDLDSGRYVPFEHADMLWQPMLVRDLDANILLPFSPDAGKSSNSQDLLNPPPLQLRFMGCELEATLLPAPLNLLEYRLYRVSRRKRTEMFAGCRRADERGVTHFDIRWNDGVLKFTGKLEVLPQANPQVQELAMYDDYINYYGFPRELGFIRRKQLQVHADLAPSTGSNAAAEDVLLEVIIPRVFDDGCAAQFRVNAVPGQSMLSMYKQKRAREHMFVLRGRLSVLDQRALVELRHRDAAGELVVVFQARKMKGGKDGKGGLHSWRIGFAHPLSAFQAFCILLSLNMA